MRAVPIGVGVIGMMTIAAMLTGCGRSAEEKRASADANAVGFTPPAVMSRIDFGTSTERRFRQLDRNADDRITPDELPRRNTRLSLLDRNKDGVITSTEFSEGMLKRFDAMDLNHDGTVTSEEHQAWRKANRADAATDASSDAVGAALNNTASDPAR